MPKPKTFQKAIYTIDIGQNDIADVLYKMTHDEALAAIPAMIEQVVTAIRVRLKSNLLFRLKLE